MPWQHTIPRFLKYAAAWLKIATSLRLMVYLWLEAARFRPCPGRVIGVVSSSLRDEMAASYPASYACLHIVPPGVIVPEQPPSRDEARQALGLPQEASLLLFVANDFRRKGLDTLLEALAVLEPVHHLAERRIAAREFSPLPLDEEGLGRGWAVFQSCDLRRARAPSPQPSPASGRGSQKQRVHLLVVGESGQRADYARMARELGLEDRVHFLGRQEDMRPVYAAADVLVHPTREDTFGMVVLEAMAQGLPVVVSRAPYCGLGADLAADEAVLLHDPTSSDELGAALRALLDDDARRAELAQAGRKLAARYDWAQVAQAYERLYFDLLEARA